MEKRMRFGDKGTIVLLCLLSLGLMFLPIKTGINPWIMKGLAIVILYIGFDSALVHNRQNKVIKLIPSILESFILLGIMTYRLQDKQLVGQQAIMVLGLYIGICLSFLAWGYLWGNIVNRITWINVGLQIIVLAFCFMGMSLSTNIIKIVLGILIFLVLLCDYHLLVKKEHSYQRKEYIRNIIGMSRVLTLWLILFFIATTSRSSTMSDIVVLVMSGLYLAYIIRNWEEFLMTTKFQSKVLMFGFLVLLLIGQCLLYAIGIKGIIPFINMSLLFLIVKNQGYDNENLVE